MTQSPRIIFMGTPDFAVPSLAILCENNFPILAVVTAPDKPRGRGQELSPTPIKKFAQDAGLEVLQPTNLKDPAFADEIRALSPDIIVVVAFRILPKEVFQIPALGTFNLHASLLPKYRGAAPINWAIINGETETGVTTFYLQEKVDTGNILLRAKLPITPEDDAGSLHDKLSEVGAEVVLHTVRLIGMGKVEPKPQDNVLATAAPKIFKDDCRIDWNVPSSNLWNFIRGLSPHPAAFSILDGRSVKFFRSELTDTPCSKQPGSFEVSKSALYVHTRDRLLSIIELQLEGKKRMNVEEFLRGQRISTGSRFE